MPQDATNTPGRLLPIIQRGSAKTMSANIIPQNALSGQQPNESNNQILQNWMDTTQAAINALYVWRARLKIWQAYPGTCDDTFDQALAILGEAGLLQWAAGAGDLDYLRQLVDGEK